MHRDLTHLKVAIVTDWMVSPGGADRHLISLLGIFEEADIFTTIYNPEKYVDGFKIDADVYETFLGKRKIFRNNHRHVNVLSPIAFENLDLSNYDLIISLSAGSAKGVIPDPTQTHIGIILTPPRSLWDGESNIRALGLKGLYKLVSPFVKTYLRIWDQVAIKRVDYIVSISKFIEKKIAKTYRRESDVIYPGVNKYWFDDVKMGSVHHKPSEPFYLIVSRLYDYKRVDWAIKAAKQGNTRLLVVGVGPDEPFLRDMAGDETEFLGWQNDETVKYLYKKAEALLFCGVEDFGYVPVEAMASGCPVLAYNEGGVTETVTEKTGAFFSSVEELAAQIHSHSREKYNEKEIIDRAKLFSEEVFVNKITQFIEKKLEI